MFVKLIAASAFAANLASAVKLREETQIPETNPIVSGLGAHFRQQISEASEAVEAVKEPALEALEALYNELHDAFDVVEEKSEDLVGKLLEAFEHVKEALEGEGNWQTKALEASAVLREDIVDVFVNYEDLQEELLVFLGVLNHEIEGAQKAYDFLASDEVAEFVKAKAGLVLEDAKAIAGEAVEEAKGNAGEAVEDLLSDAKAQAGAALEDVISNAGENSQNAIIDAAEIVEEARAKKLLEE